jgi:hypothetical protein
LDIGRQYLVNLLMKTHIVTHVDEQRTLGPYPSCKGDGIIHQLMRVMGLVDA